MSTRIFTIEKVEIAAEFISAEFGIRLNSNLSYTELYKYILLDHDLLKAIKSDSKYTSKRKCVQWLYLFDFDQ